jgi:hypothetical protein
MTTITTLKAACLFALTLALTSSLAASKKDVDEAMSRDGLQKISVKGLDLAYARPGASLAAYKRVKLDPVEVEFDKSWDPERTGSRIKLSSEEREKIRGGQTRPEGVRQGAAEGRRLPDRERIRARRPTRQGQHPQPHAPSGSDAGARAPM